MKKFLHILKILIVVIASIIAAAFIAIQAPAVQTFIAAKAVATLKDATTACAIDVQFALELSITPQAAFCSDLNSREDMSMSPRFVDICGITTQELTTKLKPYIESLFKEASATGAPLLRTMFYEFPDDDHAWELQDQYMFGSEYLVAPVLHAGETERDVYLPAGRWENVNDGKQYDGQQTVVAAAPLEVIPVFKKIN